LDGSQSLLNPDGQAAITDEFSARFHQFDPDLMLPALYAIDFVEGNVEKSGNLLPYLVKG
jgi:hypothetical protein